VDPVVKPRGARLISITNSLFTMGLASLPGMMTGQILFGVSPLLYGYGL